MIICERTDRNVEFSKDLRGSAVGILEPVLLGGVPSVRLLLRLPKLCCLLEYR